ncbi:peptidoglycan-binding protein [Panacibacter sp. DH6]|uniref:Peptidoglycan-binding protein n=1 Tax=Panacibacter microcysteis TaxID=2793269 RepID=A0A931GYE1_9BACT|nr:GH25 family lysozyme [Panacibacter microcysteis]MBG9375522.1 peptidoglycan-binding protein [Panacibacter microcysteis]
MKTLKKGSKNADVKFLQQSLAKLGYVISVDGIFGNDTERTVIRFQNDNDLSPDGVVGSNTWAVLTDLTSVRPAPVFGIDVSHHNGAINWNNINQSQVNFVYCKATQGRWFRDPMLHSNMNELKRLNFIRGVYHFFTFKDVTAAEQVNNLLGTGIDFSQPGTLPPVLDVEWQQSNSLNQYIKDNQALCAQKVQAWLAGIEAATGRKPLIYTNRFFWQDYMGNPPGFDSYLLWVASYRNDEPRLPEGWNDYAIWQFTESASVQGIPGNVDKNVFNGSVADLRKLALLG